jgi:hypothetical protein
MREPGLKLWPLTGILSSEEMNRRASRCAKQRVSKSTNQQTYKPASLQINEFAVWLLFDKMHREAKRLQLACSVW